MWSVITMLKQVLKITGKNYCSLKSGSMLGGGEGTFRLLEQGAYLLIGVCKLGQAKLSGV